MIKLTIREIKKNWFSYLAMIVITLLAVTLFTGFIANTKTLNSTIDNYYELSNFCDLYTYTTNITEEDKEFYDNLGVDYEYRLYSESRINNTTTKLYVGDNEISKPIITSGNSGVLVDEKYEDDEEFQIGKNITIDIPYLGSINVMVTGYMHFIEVANVYSAYPVYITKSIFEEQIGPMDSYYNQVLIKGNKDVKQDISDYYYSKENNNLLFIFDKDSIESTVLLKGEATQSLKMIYVFPVIFILVSTLVILTTVSQLILRERTNIGTLKAIGISNKRIIFHYALMGGILCFIGGIIGSILGPLIIPKVMMIKYNLVYSFPSLGKTEFSFTWSLIATMIVSLLALGIGILASRNIIKENPASCMRPLVPKDNFIVKKTVDSNQKYLSVKMAFRNIVIKPSRAIMTIVGIMGCVALLACGFGIGDTLTYSVNRELGEDFKYDIKTSFSSIDFVSQLDALKNSNRINDFETYEIYYMNAKANDESKDVNIYVINPNSAMTTLDTSKTIISKAIADDLGVKEGDFVNLTIGTCTYDLKIEEIRNTAISKGLFVSTNMFSSNFHSNGAWITTNNSDDMVDYINTINGTSDAVSMDDVRSNINSAIESINMIKMTLMVFAIMLSIVVLYNLSLLNIKERFRDIATMKVLGFKNSQIARSLLYEIMSLTIIGTILGLLLGYPILCLVMSINKIEVITFIYHIYFSSYVYSFLLSVITALIINILFSFLIGKIRMIESLKSVE